MTSKTLIVSAGVCAAASFASGNLLTNGGFEDGLNGWIAFGNAFAESANPPQFDPHAGNGMVSMFGNFSGGFNVTGIFQEFAASAGQSWTMDAWSRHWSGDAMIGGGAAGGGNWVVMKLAFKDAGDAEIGFAEGTILDGTFATDVWHDNAAIKGIAPVGTVQVEAFILYLQPVFDGGAAHVDDVVVTPAPSAAVALGLCGAGLAFRRRR